MPSYDAFLLVSFGGPEAREDVMPFLENATRGRGVPRERLLEVAEHYYHFGGVSPINAQCRALMSSLSLGFPLYWGNRNWHPFLADTLRRMVAEGRRRALAFPTSAFGSYSGCRQYREDIARARAEVGSGAPEVVMMRRFFNHPGFIEAMTESTRAALSTRSGARLVFTAHSLPMSLASTSPYVQQVLEAARLVAEGAGCSEWRLAYQSRSGPPSAAWLEPDILDVLRAERASGATAIVVVPLGFLSDHMEVLWDLDHEARARAEQLGLTFVRAATVGTHPRFLRMIAELVAEYTEGAPPRSVGRLPPSPAECPADCCPPPARPALRSQ